METNIASPDSPKSPVCDPPKLWNPNAAANWCIFLTPLFGAILHAKNWQALNEPERARANIVWAITTGIFIVSILASFFVSQSEELDRVFQILGLVLLFGWYFSQGKPQAKYVKKQLNNEFSRRGWAVPLLIGFSSMFFYLVLGFALAIFVISYSSEGLIAEIKPALIEEWEKSPEIKKAKIDVFTLEDIGNGLFVGTIDARINGEPVQFDISVDATWEGVSWTID